MKMTITEEGIYTMGFEELSIKTDLNISKLFNPKHKPKLKEKRKNA